MQVALAVARQSHQQGLSCTHPRTQADLDLGNYERFLDITLKKDNNLTTGKIYQVGAM